MRTKLFVLIIFISCVFHSCLDYSLPEQIELEVEGSINLPVKIATSNWGSIITNVLKDAFSGGMPDGIGVEIYNVNHGQDVQAFCVNIPMEISTSLNPYDYMGEIADLTHSGSDKELKISMTVDVPSNIVLVNRQPIPIFNGSASKDFNGISLGVDGEFLHALIEEGTISLDIYDENDNPLEKTYSINISQVEDTSSQGAPYKGFSDPPTSITNDNPSLKNKNINGKPIDISVSINITHSGGLSLGYLTITMNISEYRELHWNMNSITDALKAEPLPLGNIDVLNWIKFAPWGVDEKGEINAGIGININFEGTSEKIINGLAMSVECTTLDSERNPQVFLNGASKPLNAGNNIFGNEEEYTLYLKENEDLNFVIKLLSSNSVNTNVLKLEGVKVEAGKPLKIDGDAKLFLHWEEAEVDMIEALKYSQNDGVFKGQFPEKNKDPIDLSMLKEYIEGFSIVEGKEGIQAAAYLSGPDQTINKDSIFNSMKQRPSLLVSAEYDTTLLEVMRRDQTNGGLMLEVKHIDIANDANYTYKDKNGNIIYKRDELPPDRNDFGKFVNIINAMPEKLVFHYEVTLPDTIIVTPNMFFDKKTGAPVPNDILANIIVLMHLKLKAGETGGRIKYSDMFKDQNDLFGRETPEEDSMFSSLNGYVKIDIDFAGTFFTGGSLFIEKKVPKPKLYPNGITVNGSKIGLYLTNNELDIINNNLIDPDFRLEFERGATITIPRNMGLTSLRIEAKSKNTIKLDF